VPRVALEYGRTWCAWSTSCRAVSASTQLRLDAQLCFPLYAATRAVTEAEVEGLRRHLDLLLEQLD